MVNTSTEAAYDFGVAACDAARPLSACFARNTTGLSERDSKARQQADIYLKGDVNHAVKYLFSLGCLRKNEQRTRMCDLRGVPLLAEAESAVLLELGSVRLTTYVGGAVGKVAAGFLAGANPAFPKHILISREEGTSATEDPDADDQPPPEETDL